MDAIEQITKAAINAAGGAVAVAQHFGILRSAVYQWKRTPATRVVMLERISGIPRHVLRPDIFPAPEKRRKS